jgi:hypothetical protein
MTRAPDVSHQCPMLGAPDCEGTVGRVPRKPLTAGGLWGDENAVVRRPFAV